MASLYTASGHSQDEKWGGRLCGWDPVRAGHDVPLLPRHAAGVLPAAFSRNRGGLQVRAVVAADRSAGILPVPALVAAQAIDVSGSYLHQPGLGFSKDLSPTLNPEP